MNTKKAEASHMKSRVMFDKAHCTGYETLAIVKMEYGKPEQVGTILIKWPKDGGGTMYVSLSQCGESLDQFVSLKGYGYNKLETAMEGMEFQGLIVPRELGGWKKFLRENGYFIF